MSECCNEYDCKRRKPVLIRLAPFSRRLIAATAYTVHGQTVAVSRGGKHDVHEDVLRSVAELLEANGMHPDAAEYLRDLADESEVS